MLELGEILNLLRQIECYLFYKFLQQQINRFFISGHTVSHNPCALMCNFRIVPHTTFETGNWISQALRPYPVAEIYAKQDGASFCDKMQNKTFLNKKDHFQPIFHSFQVSKISYNINVPTQVHSYTCTYLYSYRFIDLVSGTEIQTHNISIR